MTNLLIEIIVILDLILIALGKRYFEFIWWKFFLVYIVNAIGCIFGIYISIKERRNPKVNYPVFVPFLFLTIFSLLSFFWAYNWYKCFKLLMTFSAGVVPFLLILFFYRRDSASLRRILWAIAVTGGLAGFYGIVQYHHLCDVLNSVSMKVFGFLIIKNPQLHPICILPKDQYGQLTPISTFGLSNFAAEYIIMSLPAGFILTLFERRYLRFLSLPFFLSALYYLIIAKNRGGYMGFIAGFSLGAVLLSARLILEDKVSLKRVISYALAMVLLFALFLAFHPSGKKAVEKFKTSFDLNHPTIQTRLHAWKAALNMIKDHPIVGVGMGNYEIFSWRYQTQKLEEMTLKTNTRVDKTHNEYLQVFSELGIIGLALFLWLLFEIVRTGLLGVFRCPYEFFPYILAFLMGVVAILVDSLFAFPLQFPATVVHFWIYTGVIMVIADLRGSKFFNRIYEFVEKTGPPFIIVFLSLLTVTMVTFSVLAYRMVQSEWHYRAGQLLKAIPKLRASLREYNLANEYEPFNERVYYDRAFVKLKLGDVNGAIEDLAKCLSYVPYFGKARKEYAIILYKANRLDEALSEFLEAAKTHFMGRGEIYSFVSLIYLNKGLIDEARKYLEMADDYLPEKPGKFDADIFFNLGTVALSIGDEERGEKYLLKTIELNPDEVGAFINLGVLYVKRKDYDRALEYLKEAERRDNTSPILYYNMAVAYAEKGEADIALEYLEKALTLNPQFRARAEGHPVLKKLLRRIRK